MFAGDKTALQKFLQLMRDFWNDIVKSFKGESQTDIRLEREARKMADKFNELYNEMIKGKETTNSNGEGVRYSISYTTDNTPIVVVNDDILRYSNNDKDLVKLVKKSLGRFKKVPIKGQTIKFLYDTKNEYTNSGYTKYLRYNNNKVYKDKMRLSAHPQEIIYATTDYINEGLKHQRKDNIVDFARGNLLFDISGRKYSAEVVIGFTYKGVCELHDIVNINDAKFNYKKVDASNTVGLNNKPVRIDASTNDNISQPDPFVNTYSMQNSKNNAENSKNSGTRGNLQSDYTAKRITSDMTDSERAEIIKDKVISAPYYEGQADTIINENSADLESGKKRLIKSALSKISKEFGVKGNYNINDGNYNIYVSNNSVSESATKITNPKQLAKLFPRLNEALTNAIGIETHKNRYYYDDSTLEVHEFLSGYIESDYFIPIRFGVKEIKNGMNLYVMIDGEKIKMSEVVKAGLQNKSGDTVSRSDNISLSQLIPKVNSKDIIKYLPDSLLTEKQLEIKIKALEETQKYSDKKNDSKYIKYINENKVNKARDMLKKLASDKGYVEKDGRYINENRSNKLSVVTYDDNGKVIPFSQRYDNTNSDTRYNIQSENDVDINGKDIYNDNSKICVKPEQKIVYAGMFDKLNKNPEFNKLYKEGKKGNTESAVSLCKKYITNDYLEKFKSQYKNVNIIPVIGLEGNTDNILPQYIGKYIAQTTGNEYYNNIVKTTKNGIRGKTAKERLSTDIKFKFDNPNDVDIKGKHFVIFDYCISTGTTVKALEDFIIEHSGIVDGFASLGKGRDSTDNLAITQEQLKELVSIMGGEYKNDLSRLTSRQAEVLIRYRESREDFIGRRTARNNQGVNKESGRTLQQVRPQTGIGKESGIGEIGAGKEKTGNDGRIKENEGSRLNIQSEDEFDYRDTFFKDFDGKYYKVTLAIGKDNGVLTIYNVTPEKSNLPTGKIISRIGSKPYGKLPIDYNVSQPDTFVNTYSMQNEKNNAENSKNSGTRGNLQTDVDINEKTYIMMTIKYALYRNKKLFMQECLTS